MSKPISVIAVPKSRKPIEVAAFDMGGITIIANTLPHVNPLDGKTEMVMADTNKKVTLSSKDLEGYTPMATCPHCNSELRVFDQSIASMIEKDIDVHCIVCGEDIKAEAFDKDFTKTVSEIASGRKKKVEEEVEEELDEEVEEELDDVELPDEEEEEEEGDEASDEASDEDEELDEELLSFNAAANIDFEDPYSVTLTPVTAGVVGVFVNTAHGMMPLGTLVAEKASDDVASMLKDPSKLPVLQKVLAKHIEETAGIDPKAFGHVGIPCTVSIEQVVAKKISERAEAAAVETASSVEEAQKAYKNSFEIASAGMIKGVFKNEMAAALTESLASRGVTNARKVANRIIQETAAQFMTDVIEKADELVMESENYRKAVAKTIASSDFLVEEEEDREVQTTATAFIPTIASREPATPKVDRPDFSRKALFG